METKELVEFLLEKEVSDDSFNMMKSHPSFPLQIGQWYKVVENNFGIDQPSLRYYNNELKDWPQDCKEFEGQKYVRFIEDIGAYGNKFY